MIVVRIAHRSTVYEDLAKPHAAVVRVRRSKGGVMAAGQKKRLS